MIFFRVFSENYLKIAIIIGLFLGTFLIFKMLQRPPIYNATLKNITHTYAFDSVNKNCIWKVHQPYYYMDTINTVHWDGVIYKDIRDNYYTNGDWKYGFFPLFPMVWRFLHISSLFIGLFNYLLFGLSVLIISNFFFKEKIKSFTERFCVFITLLILPPIVTYYLPYADALTTFTFSMGIWGLMKKKYWIYFVSIFLFATSRPIFVHVGLAFLTLDLLYYLKHLNFKHFIKETTLKLLPLVSGTLLVFLLFYINSGSFFKYFEVINKYWKTSFSIPNQISDWSIESFGTNVFILFFLIAPSLVLFFKHFINLYFSKNSKVPQGIFKGDTVSIKDYFFYISIIYFTGVLVFTLFYQSGTLNGLNRYIFVSPFFLIFFFYGYQYLKDISWRVLIFSVLLLLIPSFIMLTGFPELDPEINFSDFGFFILLMDVLFLYSLKYMNDIVRVLLMILLTLINLTLVTYLYNIYLCNGWIYT